MQQFGSSPSKAGFIQGNVHLNHLWVLVKHADSFYFFFQSQEFIGVEGEQSKFLKKNNFKLFCIIE